MTKGPAAPLRPLTLQEAVLQLLAKERAAPRRHGLAKHRTSIKAAHGQ